MIGNYTSVFREGLPILYYCPVLISPFSLSSVVFIFSLHSPFCLPLLFLLLSIPRVSFPLFRGPLASLLSNSVRISAGVSFRSSFDASIAIFDHLCVVPSSFAPLIVIVRIRLCMHYIPDTSRPHLDFWQQSIQATGGFSSCLTAH